MSSESTISGNHLTYTVTFDSDTQKFEFSATGAFHFIWGYNESDSNTYFLAYLQLGFNPINKPFGTSFTSDNATSLNPPSYVFIELTGNTSNSTSSNAADNGYFAKIPMNGTANSIVYYTSQIGIGGNLKYTSPQNINYFAINFFTYNRTPWNNNGVPISLTLGIKTQ